MSIEIKGTIKKVCIDENGFVNISSDSWLSKANRIPDVKFHLSEVKSIEHSKGNFFVHPYIKFQVTGHTGINHLPSVEGLPIKTAHDPYLVYFHKSKNEEVAKFKEDVEKIISNLKNHTNTSKADDIATLILRLNELYEKGILTKSEFEDKKQDLLNRM